jgi:hypothetical protein
MVAKSGRKTDITLWDYVLLRDRLLSKPRSVLRHFKRCQIACLTELEVFRVLYVEQRCAAERIISEAAEMGIPLDIQNEGVGCRVSGAGAIPGPTPHKSDTRTSMELDIGGRTEVDVDG